MEIKLILSTNSVFQFRISQSGDLKTKLSSHNFSQKLIKQICFSILTTQKYLKPEMEIQVSSISKSFIHLFFGRSFFSEYLISFCFMIYWPLKCWTGKLVHKLQIVHLKEYITNCLYFGVIGTWVLVHRVLVFPWKCQIL